MSELGATANRCEAALWPDRDLDCAIGVAIGRFVAEPPRYEGGDVQYREGNTWPGQGGDMLVPRYTGSIDAAVSLVPEGQEWSVGRQDGQAIGQVGVHRRSGSTEALALSAAALAARILSTL